MPSSRFDNRGAVALLAGLLLLGGAGGCDELNADYDPDAGPLCTPGVRQCSPDGGVPEVCQSDKSWTALPPCWAGSGCSDGLCLPTDPVLRCDNTTECTTAGDVCTVFVDPDAVTSLSTFCAPPPNVGGRPGGQACTLHEDCASGFCFRRVCYEACADDSLCTNVFHDCALLEVTVDGVQDTAHIRGCVTPAE